MRVPMLAAALAVAATTLAASAAHAEQPIAAVEKDPANSINLSPLGLAFGAYSVNYEHLTPAGHGVIVELGYASSGGDDTETSSKSALIGYRWHWRGQQNSGFLGVSLAMGSGTGNATIEVDGQREHFELGFTALSVTGNIGKRWQFDSGVNVTLRVGAGWGSYAISSDSTDPDAQKAVDAVNEVLTLIPFAVDGELSIGYSF